MNPRKLGFGLLLGALALLLVAGLTIATTTNQASPASAAPAAQATATTTTPAATKPAETKPAETKPADTKPADSKREEVQKYLDAFSKNWAAQLGVSEDKLNSTFSAAIASTLDQMVKDGKITQAEADKLKTVTKDGFKSFLNLPNLGGKGGPGDANIKSYTDVFETTISATAQVLNLTPDALKDKLKAGQSLAEIAQAQNVDLQKVKDTITANVKTQLDKLVKDGKITQAQADEILKEVPMVLEKLLNQPMKPGK